MMTPPGDKMEESPAAEEQQSFEREQSSKLLELPEHKLAELDFKIYERDRKVKMARDRERAEQMQEMRKEMELRAMRELKEKQERDFEYLKKIAHEARKKRR